VVPVIDWVVIGGGDGGGGDGGGDDGGGGDGGGEDVSGAVIVWADGVVGWEIDRQLHKPQDGSRVMPQKAGRPVSSGQLQMGVRQLHTAEVIGGSTMALVSLGWLLADNAWQISLPCELKGPSIICSTRYGHKNFPDTIMSNSEGGSLTKTASISCRQSITSTPLALLSSSVTVPPAATRASWIPVETKMLQVSCATPSYMFWKYGDEVTCEKIRFTTSAGEGGVDCVCVSGINIDMMMKKMKESSGVDLWLFETMVGPVNSAVAVTVWFKVNVSLTTFIATSSTMVLSVWSIVEVDMKFVSFGHMTLLVQTRRVELLVQVKPGIWARTLQLGPSHVKEAENFWP
jgi:hypothetical protein